MAEDKGTALGLWLNLVAEVGGVSSVMVEVTRKDTPWRRIALSACPDQNRASRTTRCWRCCRKVPGGCCCRRSRPRSRRSSPPMPGSWTSRAVVALPRPGSGVTDDPLLAVLREGARRMLTQAIEAEVEAFLAAHAELVDGRGRRRVVRNGHAPARRLQTGIGPIEVRRPRVRDRGDAGSEPIAFTSAILPPYLRRTRNIEELLPWLYLKGISTGRFEEALAALLGPEAPGLSATAIRRLEETRTGEHERWRRRDLSAKRHVHLRADATGSTSRPGSTATGGASWS